ncbi:hypothetical protein KAR28_00935 [Candidatus Parcubacteria bacterium]|nr:hypothetical protein [Candidatus Parcubacteria bacterium]
MAEEKIKIKEDDIPDINRKPKVIACYLAGSLAGSGVGMDKKIELSRKNLVRLIDKAIYEYKMARETIIEEFSSKENGVIYIHIIINHFENCLNSIHRVFNLYESIKRNQNGPYIDRSLKKLTKVHKDVVRKIRNMVEHIDDDIQNDRIQNGQAVALRVTKDYKAIEIGDNSIKLTEVVDVLNHLYDISRIVANYKIEK